MYVCAYQNHGQTIAFYDMVPDKVNKNKKV
jgi:hypothetical protein